MSLRLRLNLIAALLLLGGLGAAWIAESSEEAERAQLRRAAQAGMSRAAAQWRDLARQNLQQWVEHYAHQAEVATLLADPDPNWTAEHFAPSEVFWQVQGIWILDPSGRPIHTAIHPDYPTLTFPLPVDRIHDHLRHHPHSQFYRHTPAGLVEFHTAPIPDLNQNSSDHPPAGWLVIGQVWDDAHLIQLSPDSLYHMTVVAPDAPLPPIPDDTIRVSHLLHAEDGKPIARWDTTRQLSHLQAWQDVGIDEIVLMLGFTGLATLAVVLLMRRWVLRPVAKIDAALRHHNTPPLATLSAQPDEFGKIAHLIESSFVKERLLRAETSRRQQIETDLRANEANLRSALRERAQLGTDLHDSTIQILYAAGLNLAAIERRIHDTHPNQSAKLREVRQNLQRGVDDLRWFISNLETETSPESFQDAIHAMLNLVRNTNRLQVTDHIEPDTADLLSEAQRIHLLHILREAVTNAVKHSHARHLHVQLRRRDDQICASIEDDGVGLPAETTSAGGHGLANIRRRAAEAGAQLSIRPATPQGTRIDLNLTLVQ